MSRVLLLKKTIRCGWLCALESRLIAEVFGQADHDCNNCRKEYCAKDELGAAFAGFFAGLTHKESEKLVGKAFSG